MHIRYGTAKIAGVATTAREFQREFGFNAFVKVSSLHKLDTDRNLYIRNRAVSEYERYGPNENGDAFPQKELEENYQTFVGQRVTVDHKDDQVIGYVLTSKYLPWQEEVSTGGFVENILVVDKEKAEEKFPGLLDLILSGKVTDTSMGALVKTTECSVCGNLAESEEEFCDHVRNYKMQQLVLASGERRLVYEVCHGVSFFEDSIIVPLHLGGQAGGAGADSKAKMLQIIATRLSNSQEPEVLLRRIEASLPPRLFSKFVDELSKALEGSRAEEKAFLVLMKYSAQVPSRAKEAISQLALLFSPGGRTWRR